MTTDHQVVVEATTARAGQPVVTEHRGRAMGTSLHLVVVTEADDGRDPEAIIRTCRREVERLEALWSRFSPTSEITALNRLSGPQLVSAETRDLVSRAIEAWHRTGGRFDPTVHDDLVHRGYDRDFASIETGRHRAPTAPSRPRRPTSACGRIVVDDQFGTVELPADTSIDPGGIGKGLAADRIVDLACRLGASGALVNLGGDLRCTGRAPSEEGWVIEARGEPGSPTRVLALTDGGVATSTCLRRRWLVGDDTRHHLIDPDTGRSRPTAARQVTVVAATAADAEVLATALAVTGLDLADRGEAPGPPDVEAMLGRSAALVVDHRGRVGHLGPIERFLR